MTSCSTCSDPTEGPPASPTYAQPDERPWRVALALACLVAAWLRGRGLADFAITHWDEGLAWRGARWFASLGTEGHYSPTHAPPLVSALLGAWHALVGGGPERAIWLVWGASVLSVAAGGWLGRELAGRWAGLAAAWGIALSALHQTYGRTLLTESFYALFLLALLAAGLRALRLGGARRWLVAGVLGALLQATKYNGFVALVPLSLAVLLKARGSDRPGAALRAGRRLALLVGPTALVIGANLAAIARLGDLGAFFEHYGRYVGERASARDALETYLRFCVSPSVWLLSLFGVGIALWRHGPRGFVVAATLALYVGFALRYAFYLRLLLPVATLSIVLVGATLEEARRRSRGAFGAVLGLWLVSSAIFVLQPTLESASTDRFDGYARAEREWRLAEREPVPLFATQAFVWSEAVTERGGEGGGERRTAVIGNPAGERARAYLASLGARELLFVWDLGAFSRQREWHLGALHDALVERPGYERIDATPNLDCLQNNLLLRELRELDHDEALARRVLGVHAVPIRADELAALVLELGVEPPPEPEPVLRNGSWRRETRD